jgi:hypothetical protein
MRLWHVVVSKSAAPPRAAALRPAVQVERDPPTNGADRRGTATVVARKVKAGRRGCAGCRSVAAAITTTAGDSRPPRARVHQLATSVRLFTNLAARSRRRHLPTCRGGDGIVGVERGEALCAQRAGISRTGKKLLQRHATDSSVCQLIAIFAQQIVPVRPETDKARGQDQPRGAKEGLGSLVSQLLSMAASAANGGPWLHFVNRARSPHLSRLDSDRGRQRNSDRSAWFEGLVRA